MLRMKPNRPALGVEGRVLRERRRLRRLGTFAALSLFLAGTPFGNKPDADLIGHGGMVRAVDVSADGTRVLTGSFDFTARLWDFGDQAEIAVLDAHEGPVTSVAFLPDGNRALTTSDDMTAILWDLAKSEPAEILALEGHKHKVMAAAIDGQGNRAATGGWDKAVKVWDLETGEELLSVTASAPVNAVAFVNDGKWVAAGGHDGKIGVWDTADGRLEAVLEGHELGITQFSASVDGMKLISSSIDRSLRLWDIEGLKEVRAIEHGEGRRGQVYSTAISPDSKSALSAGKDGRLVQWDLSTGEPIRTIFAHDKIVWAVRFTPDGRFAVTASSDENAKVWHLGTGDRIGLQGVDEETARQKPWLTSKHPGAALFTKCANCHALTADGPRRSGPHFQGLWGRRVGGLKDYKYSQALLNKDFVWNEKTLFQLFDEGPDVMLPGTKMPVQRVTDPNQLAELVDFIRELTTSDN